MKILMMHKHDPRTEAGEKPPLEIITKMGAFIGDYAKSGRLVDGAGLGATKSRTRVGVRGGQSSVQHGPYAGESELPAAISLIKVANRDEGVAWAKRYGEALGDCDLELGKITEPWDLGVMPEPPNPPLQLLLIEKADRVTEAGGRPADQKAKLAQLASEMTDAGVLVRSRRLDPSTKAKRLTFRKNQLSIIDGPFSESKELIGGFAILELSGFDEAIEVCKPYAEILGGDLEIDLRVVTEDEPA